MNNENHEAWREYAAAMTGPTISLADATRLVKCAGITISDEFLGAGIQEGKFPFGFAIRGKEWRYWISLPKLVAWLRDWSGDA